ncbi:hypothetical protein GCM10027089_49630 [Nocardia thraciensis]
MAVLAETNDGPLVLSPREVEEIGRQLDELRERITADLGQCDRDYIYSVIKAQRGVEVAGRGLKYLVFLPPYWLAGVAALSVCPRFWTVWRSVITSCTASGIGCVSRA